MSNTPDYEALAKRYLDLWQDQMARMAGDPAMADMLARTFTLMTQSAQAFAPGAQAPGQASSEGRGPRDDPSRTTGKTHPAAPSGAEAAAPLSGRGGVDVPQLLQRLDSLEKRVAELEAGQRIDTPTDAGPARGSRSRKAGRSG